MQNRSVRSETKRKFCNKVEEEKKTKRNIIVL
jgi:hypothetical protein